MGKLSVFIGFPGSGKSTEAAKRAKDNPNVIVVNKDAIRTMFRAGKYVYDTGYEDLVGQVARRTVVRALMEGFDVVLDECNLVPSKRDMSFLKPRLREVTHIEFVWFKESSMDTLLKRREDNYRGYSKDHWREVIDSMMGSFVPPDFKAESPDSMVTIP